MSTVVPIVNIVCGLVIAVWGFFTPGQLHYILIGATYAVLAAHIWQHDH